MMGQREASDAALLAASGSDPEAFARFYDRYEAALVGYFGRRTGDPEIAACGGERESQTSRCVCRFGASAPDLQTIVVASRQRRSERLNVTWRRFCSRSFTLCRLERHNVTRFARARHCVTFDSLGSVREPATISPMADRAARVTARLTRVGWD
jgi:hypothetical protein